MTEEAKKSRAEYLKAWRAANPEKNRQYQATYWERKAQKNKLSSDSNDQNDNTNGSGKATKPRSHPKDRHYQATFWEKQAQKNKKTADSDKQSDSNTTPESNSSQTE